MISLGTARDSSVAAELKAHDRQLFANFIEAGDAEVLALKQVVTSLPDELSDQRQPQAGHAFAGPDRKVEIGDRPLQQRLLVG